MCCRMSQVQMRLKNDFVWNRQPHRFPSKQITFFPLPETLVRNPRLLLSQGKAIKHVDLVKGIPRRFANAYMASEIFYVGGKTIDAA